MKDVAVALAATLACLAIFRYVLPWALFLVGAVLGLLAGHLFAGLEYAADLMERRTAAARIRRAARAQRKDTPPRGGAAFTAADAPTVTLPRIPPEAYAWPPRQ